MVMNRATAQAALEARREATLGQMRCLAALAEWEQLATLCAREWELSAGVGAPGAGGVGAGGDAVLRGRMAPLATQAAWHLGDWCVYFHFHMGNSTDVVFCLLQGSDGDVL